MKISFGRVKQLWDPEHSPLTQFPWVFRTVFQIAPVEASLNLLAALLLGLGPAAVMLALQRVIDVVSAGASTERIMPTLLGLAATQILTQVGGAIWPITNNRLREKMMPAVMEMSLHKAASLSLAQFHQPETYDVINRAMNGGQVPGVFWRSNWVGLMAIQALSAIALLAVTSGWLALVAAMVSVPLAWAGSRQGRRLYQMDRKQTPERRMTNYLAALLSNREAATELRAYQLVSFFQERWRRLFARMQSQRIEALWRGTREGMGAELVSVGLFAGAMAMVGYLARVGGLVSVGAVVTVAAAVHLLYENLSQLAQESGLLWQEALPLLDLHRFFQLPEEDRLLGEGLPFPEPDSGSIRFESVTFQYPGREKPVLDRLSFEIRQGEKIALVGVNGAGKSTLTKLLVGLYKPTSGRITIGGVDLAAISPESLRRHVSCVFQDFGRFAMTVADNVAMGRLGADQTEVEEASRAAGLDGFVDSLPQGYNTLLGKSFTGGVDLSGGQWQRVALARAFVRDADIIILDEPTAALDARAELDLFGKFVDLVEGRTAVLISHRLGSARLADRIILLEDGRIAECGSHDELLAQGGQYATLFRTQAHWYEDKLEPVGAGKVAIS